MCDVRIGLSEGLPSVIDGGENAAGLITATSGPAFQSQGRKTWTWHASPSLAQSERTRRTQHMSHPGTMASPEREKPRLPAVGAPARPRYTVVATVSTFLMTVVAVLIGPLGVLPSAQAANSTYPYSCEGGSSSGQGAPTCSNIHNVGLLSERPLPSTVYRGDSRLPYEIFTNGFTAAGHNYDIPQHVHGGDNAADRGYISTTGTLGVGEVFARGQGLRNLDSAVSQATCSSGRLAAYALIPGLGNYLIANCAHGTVTVESFVYQIDPTIARNAVYIPDEIRGDASLHSIYAGQDEWAYVHRIPRRAIVGVRIYRMTATYTGTTLDPRQPTFQFDRFVINPHYNEATNQPMYDPANDTGSGFGYTTALNVPALPANQYNRGCEEINRCRGGG